jgi:glutamate dehydrogenase
MSLDTVSAKTDLLAAEHKKKKILQHISAFQPHPVSSEFENFVYLLYQGLSLTDLESSSPESFFLTAQNIWEFLQIRNSPSPKIHIGNIINDPRADASLSPGFIIILNDNMPFLVDSLMGLLTAQGSVSDFLIHPVLNVQRNDQGHLIHLEAAPPHTSTTAYKSLIYIKLRDPVETNIEPLKQAILSVLEDVRLAVEDWKPMRQKILEASQSLNNYPSSFTQEMLEEIQAFLVWLEEGCFTFLGVREYTFDPKGNPKVEKSYGTLRKYASVFFDGQENASLEEEVLKSPELFKITKTIRLSSVHRTAPMDVIRLKKVNDTGHIIGEYEFLGLLTSMAYSNSIKNIPILRKKMNVLLQNSGLSSDWHDGKNLIYILESFPRDELFQITEDELYTTTHAILQLQERQRLALFVRRDSLGHFVSCLVYIPRDRYSSRLRERISHILETRFQGHMTSFSPLLDRNLPYARVYYTLATSMENTDEISLEALEKEAYEASLSWDDYFKEALFRHFPLKEAQGLCQRFLSGFPSHYQEHICVSEALLDLEIIQKVLETQDIRIKVQDSDALFPMELKLKVYHPSVPLILSEILPIFENLGFKILRETSYKIMEQSQKSIIWIHEFKAICKSSHEPITPKTKNLVEDCFIQIQKGITENDGFNGLVLAASFSWREAMIFRAYYKYLKQIEFTYSQAHTEECLIRYAFITQQILELFKCMLDPTFPVMPPENLNEILEKIEEQLDKVDNVQDDKTLRHYLNLVLATLRTNYFQTTFEGNSKPSFSFKLDSRLLQSLPQPRPMYEAFVYSPDMEAIHLRGGKVARGGIRWSDRQEDFRTEILSLMKAQRVKNTVIVPVGAKGGFILKRGMDLTGDDRLQYGIACYKTMICGLLDLTDNLHDGKIIKPQNTRCLDDDDPYLVVAADKGTATFSDVANKISQDYNFWLGDAFASGGSLGYDHKKMGITARGAWESVKRHFRELSIDIQKSPFTVIGVGDMSGDVFGNGMILSNQIQLVGAFNHMHIFLDPNPDPLRSYEERKRLFNLPRSSWEDYNPDLLSPGGGIFHRQQKYISLSSEIKERLNLTQNRLTPDELIQILLTAPVDLLWFGGIGTYVKSSTQTHESVGDKTNDNVRVDAILLQCKVIGEGANLAMTQPARVEFSLKGGRLNTDAIDNSAGVDCSDHEVNIKILLNHLVSQRKMSIEERNTLLAHMTEEVGILVLRDNYLQTQAISIIEGRGRQILERQNRLMRVLERAGILNRQVENLPTEETIDQRIRAGIGLTRPEIAVLLAYGKLYVYEKILHTNLPDEDTFISSLFDYFPTPLRTFYDDIMNHPLKREIIATIAANNLVNRVGPTFFTEMIENMGVTPYTIIRSYFIVTESFGLNDYWQAIEGLDTPLIQKFNNKCWFLWFS